VNLEDGELILEKTTAAVRRRLERGLFESTAASRRGEGYVALHRDNPDTREVLGSLYLNIPLVLEREAVEGGISAGIPADGPDLICLGSFDAVRGRMDNLTVRCTVRNEHGHLLSQHSPRLRELEARATELSAEAIRTEGDRELSSLGRGKERRE
jgi:hypothetical protein